MEVNSIEEMNDNGDVFELSDGRRLVLHIEGDPDASVNDYECYGRIEWTRDNDYGSVRPSDMTGRAIIMDRDHYMTLWWEPYFDKEFQRTPEQWRLEKSQMADLLRFGFSMVGLELLEKCPNCENWHTVTTEWLGGIDSLDGGYLPEVLSDLMAQMEVSV